ncbi:MAG TPA: AAA family ATPase [Kofleriaceae bacterium]|nr:AAA family ATPase [Kofleriaceae bacterium]
MIDRVHFENFKSLQDVTLDLGRLTALVGPNGCGKSSVLQGIRLLSQTAKTELSDPDVASGLIASAASIYRGPRAPRRLIYRSVGGEMRLAMRRAGGDELSIHIQVPDPRPGGSSQPALKISVGPDAPWSVSFPLSVGALPPGAMPPGTFVSPRVRPFASAVYLHLDASEMVKTSFSDDETPQMDPDGSHLASSLAWMKGAAEDNLAQITADLAAVVPGAKRFRTHRQRSTRRRIERHEVDGQPVWRPIDETLIGDRFEIEFDDGSAIPADLLSEGTVLVLGLLTKLREPQRPQLLLVDDIDRGLHLGAQVSLIKALREMMKLEPELQIVCTTHSPYLLDLFEPAEVRVLALDSERRTHARPLTEHPDFQKWKFGTQVGELWAALGEDWVIGGASG